jgi:hypothetical protein
VCGFCQSTIVREGDALKRIGKMAEVFDDYSALQLGALGQYKSVNFSVVGRLQYKYEGGSWNEWLVAVDDGSVAILSEDNGSFVWTRAVPHTRELPKPEQWRVGSTTAINGKSFSVASVQTVALAAAQGELPKLPPLGQSFAMVELRSPDAQVLSIDYSTTPPSLSMGQAITMEELKLTGLRDQSNATGQGGKEVKARQFNCPNCGGTVNVKLAGSKSISCPSCNSVIDLSQGIGGELRHALQDEPVRPLIALGSIGTLQGKQWQVVGFQHRLGHEVDDPDEHFGWDEYLLYNAQAGFIFLVDSTEGWSIVKPATGAPQQHTSRQYSYLGTTYTLQYAYKAETSYAAGEFYWQVQRGQVTYNEDFSGGRNVLSREQAAKEVTWSVGAKVDHTTIAVAFKLKHRAADFAREDVTPLSGGSVASIGIVGWIVVLVVMVILFSSISRCSSNCNPQVENCSNYRTGGYGGSFGGYSSGGGHK